MISVVLKLCGPLRDVVGRDEMHLTVKPPYTGVDAFSALGSAYPKVRTWQRSVRLAVNLEYVPLDHVLHDGDEICFVPPVSGG